MRTYVLRNRQRKELIDCNVSRCSLNLLLPSFWSPGRCLRPTDQTLKRLLPRFLPYIVPGFSFNPPRTYQPISLILFLTLSLIPLSPLSLTFSISFPFSPLFLLVSFSTMCDSQLCSYCSLSPLPLCPSLILCQSTWIPSKFLTISIP